MVLGLWKKIRYIPAASAPAISSEPAIHGALDGLRSGSGLQPVNVLGAAGQKVGTSKVESILGNCVILETYTAAPGSSAAQNYVGQAFHFFDAVPVLARKLQTLLDVGLGYVRLGQAATTLSGGEAQRLALARALLRQPKVLLLDEPTSALDAESKLAIMATLQRLKKFMTIIVTSHELYWMRQSDHLVILENGRVIASGTHETLMSSVGAYRRLYDKKLIEVG